MRSNTFVPSSRTFGSSFWLPTPSVFAPSVSCLTYASTGSFINASEASFSASSRSWLTACSAWPVLSPTMRSPTMPAPLCPAISQYIVYMPASSLLRSRVADSPGARSGVLRSVPSIPRLWVAVPLLVTTSSPPIGTVAEFGVIANSVSDTEVPPAADAALASSLSAYIAVSNAPNANTTAMSENTRALAPVAARSSRVKRGMTSSKRSRGRPGRAESFS